MACNCGTKEEINRLYNAYHEKSTLDDSSLLNRIKQFFYSMVTVIGWIIIFPLMTIYMLLFLFWREPYDRNINVQNFNLLKIFHLGKYARK